MTMILSSCRSKERSCPICLEGDPGPWTVHGGENGRKHPIHRDCITEWLAHDTRCPVCREVNPNFHTLMPGSERTNRLVMCIIGLSTSIFVTTCLETMHPNLFRSPSWELLTIPFCISLSGVVKIKGKSANPVDCFIITLASMILLSHFCSKPPFAFE